MKKRLKSKRHSLCYNILHYIDDDTGNEWEEREIRPVVPFEILLTKGDCVSIDKHFNSADGRKP